MSKNLVKLSRRERAAVLAACERNEVKIIDSSIFEGSAGATFEWKGTTYEIEESFEVVTSLMKYE